MAKPARKTRLLRSLTRAAKAQQSMLATLLDVYAPAPVRPARKAVPRKPAARPGLAPATGRWLAGRFPLPATQGQAVARDMQYWLYVPDRVRDAQPRDGWPLVVMLHGCHQSATQFAQGTRMNHLAEAKGFAVLYPQQSVTVQAQRCWRWYDRATQEGGGETGALASLIGTVCERHPIDRRRIYACGLSAGAGMAAILALNHPELIAAVALHSGPVFGAGHGPIGALHVMRHGAAAHADAAISGLLMRRAAAPLPPMPALLIQGEDDQVVDPVNQRQLARQWLQWNGLPAGPATRVAVKPAGRGGSRNAHEIHDYLMGRKVVLRVVRILGLGHAWSGGDPAHAFNAKAGPDASRMVLDFFGRHRR
ncbi:extracellular catalytic domain type 1 short-chain-length polyhydroxyalkanoate depolymerase [Massilia orientalis]|uniref:Alpha/beta hydrolase family esterase n=1 Tax=Massilia orientalis TaxID=3050128 RepID=A0ACC7M9L8_9BURK|nr:PHB depolymerase family esterase [Massilia sp. YIM B02787]